MKKRKWNLLDIGMLLLFLAGIGILAYPYVSRGLSQFFDQQIINYYQEQASQKNQVEVAKVQAEQQAANEKLTDSGNNPGINSFNTTVEQTESVKKEKDYFEEHTIGILSIPKIDVRLPIFDQTNDILLQKGASLLEGTSIPIGGPSTHAVLSSHRGLPEAALFDRLPELKRKDTFLIEINQEIHAYEVDQIKVIEPTDVSDLLITAKQDYVTLMTCTPYMVNTQRLLVRGHRIPYHKQQELQKLIHKKNKQVAVPLIIGGLLLGVILFLLLFLRKKRKK